MDELSNLQPDFDVGSLETRLQDLRRQVVERRQVIHDLRASVDLGHAATSKVALRSLARGLLWGVPVGLAPIVALMILLGVLLG